MPPKAETASKDLTVKSDQALVDYSGYEEHQGAGFENTTAEDFSIPFLGVLQPTSPEIETIEAAKPGRLINTVTKELFDGQKGIDFVPCTTEHVFVEWKPRAQGAGFVAVHALDSDVVAFCKEQQKFGEYKTPAGNDLVETFYVYGIMVTEGGGDYMIIAFTSTKIKRYKAWMQTARSIQIAIKNEAGQVVKRISPPLFAHKYKIVATKEKNAKGEFYNLLASFAGADASASRIAPNTDLFASAVAVCALVKEGKAKVAHNTASNDASVGAEDAASTSGQRKTGSTSTEEPPF